MQLHGPGEPSDIGAHRRPSDNGSHASVMLRRRVMAVVLAAVSLVSLVHSMPVSASDSSLPTVDTAPREESTGSGPGGRSGTASPGTELVNEVVTVSWSGFTPTQTNGLFGVILLQCSAAPTSFADCFTAEAFPSVTNGTVVQATTAADGTGSARIEVRPAAYLPSLGCSNTTACSILVYENDGVPVPAGGLPARHAIVPLSFARSQADCPPVFDFDVRVDGSATSSELFYRWASDLCQGDGAVVLDYTETSSTTGRENFLDGLVDLGVTALPAGDEELESHPGHPEYQYAPVAASAMVVAYNLRDPFTGSQIDDLVLSPRLVARLITNTSPDTFFKDRELSRLNPGKRFPSGAATRPLLRAERSASTTLITTWLAANPEVQNFMSGNDMFRVQMNTAYQGYTYPKDIFENVSGDNAYLARQGQRAVALRLFYGVSPTGQVRENTAFNGVIGIVDLPTARRFGLKVARLVQADNSVVAVTDESMAKGLAAMEPTASGTLVADVTPDDPAAYPLVRIDYAMVPRTVATDAKRDDIRAVLEYAVGAGQGRLPEGYVPLPESMRAATRTIAAGIAGPPAPATTTTTKPPRTTTTTVATTSTTRPPRSTTTTAVTTTTTTATFAPLPTTPYVPPYVPPATFATSPVVASTAAETTTTVAATDRAAPSSRRSTTTSSSAVAVTEAPTTTAYVITVPPPQLSLPDEPTTRPVPMMAGLAGLSGAALLGTVPPGRVRLPRVRLRRSWMRLPSFLRRTGV
jgi:ABC-type phosphate transport system substrate-binding protein